jgi:mono/diheme cytochrome c family protein
MMQRNRKQEAVIRRSYLGRVLVIVVITGMLGLYAATATAQSAPLLYKIYCARCHGSSGHGDGPDAGTLKTKPRDFADCKLMSTISDATRFKAIKFGGASVGLSSDMPAWSAGLDDDQIRSLMQYLKGFCKH